MAYSDRPFESVNEMLGAFRMTSAEPTEEVLDYRMGLLVEEFGETLTAFHERDAEGLVDGHIDTIVIALGTLSLFGVDAKEAFDRVMKANMAKECGKRSPEDPDGVSIRKPEGWVGPDHSNNHGVLDELFEI